MIAPFLAMALTEPRIDDFLKENAQYREERQHRLTKERGWLRLAGLHAIHEGENVLGVGGKSTISLPEGSIKGVFGTLTRSGEKVHFEPGDVSVLEDGKPVFGKDLKLDGDVLKSGRISIQAILRGDRVWLRVWDDEAPAYRHFQGLNWFKPDPKMVIRAKYEAFVEPKMIPITNVIGDVEPASFPGEVVFSLGGKEHRLLAQDAGDELFFNFQDATSGKVTYGAGRFMYTEKPKNGWVHLDFNRAENPPCAYTPFATCPLPPRGNRISIPVEAGEKKYGDH